MLPRLTKDDVVHTFKFYLAGTIHQAMTYEGQFYRLVRSFGANSRIHAHALGCKISAQRVRTVITISAKDEYKVWADVRFQLPLATLAEPARSPESLHDSVVKTLLVAEAY